MMRSNQELYAFVEDIVQEYRGKGMYAEAESLSDALSISTAPGEILGEIRLHLRRVSAQSLCAEIGRLGELRDALASLDRALGG